MASRAILFDLDGTLTDPKSGITRCIQYVVSELGYAPPEADDLHWCIGPPLQQSFAQLLQTSEKAMIARALNLYRDRFSTIGLFENTLYADIPQTLQSIRACGYHTFVATSKPHVFAVRIIDHFGLTSLFDCIYGSELDGTYSDKGDLIKHILQTESIAFTEAIMIGDRKHDMIGAKRNRMTALGVTYGYGTRQELERHGADVIVNSPHEILASLPRAFL